jgi:hypothetical protein
MDNFEVTHQAIRPIVKLQREGPKAPIAIHCPLGLKYQPPEKVTTIMNYLENQFTLHDLCDKIHKNLVKATVQALIDAADDTPLEKGRPCGIQKLIKTLKLRKVYGIDGITKECLRHLPRTPLVHLTCLISACICHIYKTC